MVWMCRAAAGLLVLLVSACSSPGVVGSPLSGDWVDPSAEFIACGETHQVTIELRILVDDAQATGSFVLNGATFPLAGTADGNELRVTVTASDGATLAGSLVLDGAVLEGGLVSGEPIACTSGGESLVTYEVNLRRT